MLVTSILGAMTRTPRIPDQTPVDVGVEMNTAWGSRGDDSYTSSAWMDRNTLTGTDATPEFEDDVTTHGLMLVTDRWRPSARKRTKHAPQLDVRVRAPSIEVMQGDPVEVTVTLDQAHQAWSQQAPKNSAPS